MLVQEGSLKDYSYNFIFLQFLPCGSHTKKDMTGKSPYHKGPLLYNTFTKEIKALDGDNFKKSFKNWLVRSRCPYSLNI